MRDMKLVHSVVQIGYQREWQIHGRSQALKMSEGIVYYIL